MRGEIREAVILAAGRGSRLGGETAKPLVKVGGVPLIGRILLGLRQAGIEKVTLVLGYQAEQTQHKLQDVLDTGLGQGLEIEFAVNRSWQKSNGISLLAVQDLVRSPFVLVMADHLFDPAMVQEIRHANLQDFAGVLAIDRLAGEIFDLPDATKVELQGNKIVKIAKNLSSYNAIDTGIFALQPTIFQELRKVSEQRGGDCSLSEGIQRLCDLGLMGWVDVSGHSWLDVDTPEALAHAEELWSNPVKG